jgi:hypothetical protein
MHVGHLRRVSNVQLVLEQLLPPSSGSKLVETENLFGAGQVFIALFGTDKFMLFYCCKKFYTFFIIIIIIIIITAIGLPPGGSSPTLVQTKIKIH